MNSEFQENEEIEIDLLALIKDLWKKKGWLILAIILGGIIAFAATRYVIKPTFQAKFTAYVNNRQESTSTLNSSDISASQALAKTYAEIIASRRLLEMATEEAGIQDTINNKSVAVSVASSTQIMTVSITLPDKQQAYNLASAIVELLPPYAADIVEGSSMKIIDMPEMPTRQFAPSMTKNVVLGCLAGFVLMAFILVIISLMDTKVKDAAMLSKKFELPVIGTIPDHVLASKVDIKYGK